jgi:hypothetical protein
MREPALNVAGGGEERAGLGEPRHWATSRRSGASGSVGQDVFVIGGWVDVFAELERVGSRQRHRAELGGPASAKVTKPEFKNFCSSG